MAKQNCFLQQNKKNLQHFLSTITKEKNETFQFEHLQQKRQQSTNR